MRARKWILKTGIIAFFLFALIFASALKTHLAAAEHSVNNNQGIVPTHLLIPSINVNANIEPVGILANGHMGVPADYNRVGILLPWTKPGQAGNAVLDGHVDHKTGPAVFFYLKNLQPGDDVIVSDSNGKKLKFKVKSVESFKTQEAPVERIFGAATRPHLNLITCTGKYDRATNEHDHRLVVFTELAE